MWKVLLGFLIRLFSLLASCVLMIAGLLELPAADAERSTNPTAPQQMMVCFLDVGQADAALVVADGEAMLIDGGNVGDSDKIVAALRKNRVSHLSVVVCTHGHEDHVGGLAAALKECTADTVYSPITRYDSKAFSDFVAYANRRGCELTVPKQGDSFFLDGATVTFLSPVPYAATVNDTSLVLRIEYGTHSFLFTADAEHDAELQMLDSGLIEQTTVLKVGHHGSDSSTSYVFLRELLPEHAVISVEKGNSYGFPDEIVLSRLADVGSTVYRTDLCGEITMETDGTTLTITTERSYDAQKAAVAGDTEETAIPQGTAYIGNKKSMKFHRLECRSLPSEENRSYFASRAAAVIAGYDACGQCKP